MNNKIVTDKEEMMAIIEKYKNSINVNPLEFASEELRGDRDVVLKAVNSHCYGLYYASEELKNDREIVLEAIKYAGIALSCASEELRNDKEIVLLAIKNGNFQTLKFASEELRNDKEVVLEAVKKNGLALRYASDELKNDREIVLDAVRNIASAFEYASEELRNDKEIIMEALEHYEYSPLLNPLEYVGKDLRSDKEVVLEAIKKNSSSIKYASEELKNDKEVVLEAVKRDGENLAYVGEKMQNNKEIVLEAVSQKEYAFEYVSEDLKKDPDVLKVFNAWQKSQKISNLELHDEEINKIIIVAKNEKEIDKVVQVILKKYPKNSSQIKKGISKNILYLEQSLESMNSLIDIGSIFPKLEKVLKNKGIIISKLESNQTGMMQLEYYFGLNVKNKTYDNYNEYYNARKLSYFDIAKKSWPKCLSEEVKFIVDSSQNDLTNEELNLLKSLSLI